MFRRLGVLEFGIYTLERALVGRIKVENDLLWITIEHWPHPRLAWLPGFHLQFSNHFLL
jgi:hypothetical protein